MVREYLDSKGAFYNGNESDNDDENYIENNELHQLPEGFANSYYKLVPRSLLQKLIKLELLHMFQKGTKLFNRST